MNVRFQARADFGETLRGDFLVGPGDANLRPALMRQ